MPRPRITDKQLENVAEILSRHLRRKVKVWGKWEFVIPSKRGGHWTLISGDTKRDLWNQGQAIIQYESMKLRIRSKKI
jgi:hypothetical protein